MSFANQALSVECLVKHREGLGRVYEVPKEIDREVAKSSITPWASRSTGFPRLSSSTSDPGEHGTVSHGQSPPGRCGRRGLGGRVS